MKETPRRATIELTPKKQIRPLRFAMIGSLLTLLAILTLVFAIGCQNNQLSGPPTFKVTKGTGLYAGAYADAPLREELSVGDLLIPAYGHEDLTCLSFTDAGLEFELCEMEVMKSGKTGWVLKKWMEEL